MLLGAMPTSSPASCSSKAGRRSSARWRSRTTRARLSSRIPGSSCGFRIGCSGVAMSPTGWAGHTWRSRRRSGARWAAFRTSSRPARITPSAPRSSRGDFASRAPARPRFGGAHPGSWRGNAGMFVRYSRSDIRVQRTDSPRNPCSGVVRRVADVVPRRMGCASWVGARRGKLHRPSRCAERVLPATRLDTGGASR